MSSPSSRQSLERDLSGLGGRVGVSLGVRMRGDILAAGSGRCEMCGNGGVFFRSMESGGVTKTDETELDAFVMGVEEFSIVLGEKATLPGTRADSKPSSSLIHETAAFRKSLLNRKFP